MAVGETVASMMTARAVLAARDADLADADGVLTGVLAAAHQVAVDSLRGLEATAAELDAAVAGHPSGTSVAGRDLARSLLERQRDIADFVSRAQAEAKVKAVALQQLAHRYRF